MEFTIKDLEELPKDIVYNGEVYNLEVFVTAWRKWAIAYVPAFDKMGEKILSQVVEPDLAPSLETNDVTKILDCKTLEDACLMLAWRLIGAKLEGKIIEYDEYNKRKEMTIEEKVELINQHYENKGSETRYWVNWADELNAYYYVCYNALSDMDEIYETNAGAINEIYEEIYGKV